MQGFETVVELEPGDAERVVREALAEEGFGILTEIDVAATLEAKLGVRRPPLKILGACNPGFAHRALEAEPSVALLLPCNVVLEGLDEGRTRVSIADPRSLLVTAGGRDDGDGTLEALGNEAATALERALTRLAQ